MSSEPQQSGTSTESQAVGGVGLFIYFICLFYFFFFFSFFSCTQFQFQGRKYDLTECFSLNKMFKKGSKNADLSNKS